MLLFKIVVWGIYIIVLHICSNTRFDFYKYDAEGLKIIPFLDSQFLPFHFGA